MVGYSESEIDEPKATALRRTLHCHRQVLKEADCKVGLRVSQVVDDEVPYEIGLAIEGLVEIAIV